MTSRRPLSVNRLSPLQLGLTAATLLLLFAVVALIVVTFTTANTARSAFQGGYVMTDLANIQRGVSQLHIAAHTTEGLSQERWADIAMQRALLSRQLETCRAQAAGNEAVLLGLSNIESILTELDNALANSRERISPNQPASPDAQVHAILARLERETQRLYDQEEQLFFGRISRALNHQRTSQIILLIMVSLLIFFGITLATSLQRSVGEEFERAYNMLEGLYAADRELHSRVTLDDVSQALVDVVVDVFGAQKSALYTWDDDAKELYVVASRGYSAVTVETMRFKLGEGLVGMAARRNEPIVVEDAYRDPRASRRIIIPENIRAFIHLPIDLGYTIYGILSICFSHPRSFDSDDLRLMDAFTHRAASAIDNARLYEQLEEAATTEERQRLARELHDAVTQTLFSASLIADVLPRIWERSPEMGHARLQELRELTRGALAEMRTLLLELRPAALIDTDMNDLMTQLGQAVTGRARLPVDVTVEGQDHCDLDAELKVTLYRIAQEALNNIAKHAQAERAYVRLECAENRIHLRVGDDGRGFDLDAVPPDHLGLGIMQDRAEAIGGTLSIDSSPGGGTTIDLVAPMPKISSG